MAWARPQFSKEEINAAGRVISSFFESKRITTFEEWQRYDNAVNIINNWRSSHAYPLNTFQVYLRGLAKRFDEGALIAQRTKRLSSIVLKLSRFPKMKLSQMQDIGGCRGVLNSVNCVNKLASYYIDVSKIKHKRTTTDNYIEKPKKSGYRGIHLVYRYYSGSHTNAVYNEMKIEIQLRSQFQHAWATAVETVGAFVRESLKSSMGSDEWLRFFSLMGSIIAMREQTALIPDTPGNCHDLVSELSEHARCLRVSERLRAYGEALKKIETETNDASLYLLQLDPSKSPPQLAIKGFRWTEIQEAQKQYAEVERLIKQNPGTDAVLVSVDSLASLPRAYPNYFADTKIFLELLEQALGDQRGKY